MQDHSVEKNRGRSLVKSANQQTKIAYRNAARKAGQAISKAKHEARAQVVRGKEEVVGQIEDLQQALLKTSDQVHNPVLGSQLGKAADHLALTAQNLAEAELEDLYEGARAYARSYTTTFLAGSFIMGLLAARFLRASEQDILCSERHSECTSPSEGGTRYADSSC